jgi:hypothetical protein
METKGRHNGNNRGVAVILVVGVLVFFLIFFLVVGIDFAYIYLARGELQNAGDSASLAGAAKVVPLFDNSDPLAYQQEEARIEAWKFACENWAAGDRVYLVTGAAGGGRDCDDPPNASELNDSNNPAGDIVVGHWDNDTRVFTPADGSTGLVVNAMKVVARRTGDHPETGGSVGLIFGGMVGWPLMDVSQVAIAMRGPLPFANTPLCVPTCDMVTPLIVNSPNLTPGARFYLRVHDGSPNIGWTSYFENDTSNTNIIAYLSGEKTPSGICQQCIFTTEGLVNPSLCEVRRQIRVNGKVHNINGVDIFGWRAVIPILPPTPCPGAKGTGCITGDPGYQPGDAYQVVKFAQVVITDAVPQGNCPGDPNPFPSGSPGIVMAGVGPGPGPNTSSILCLDCNDPTAFVGEESSILVR